MVKNEEIFILGINGSPHKKGLCINLLKESLDQAKREGAATKLAHLKDYETHFFEGTYSTRVDRGAGRLMDLVRKADGMILASPVYWANVSSLMKNFIEQLTALEIKDFELQGKAAGFIATEEEGGGWQTVLNMAGPLNHMGVLIVPYALVFYNKKFAEKSEKKWMKKDIRLLGQNVVRLARLVRALGKNYWDYDTLKKR